MPFARMQRARSALGGAGCRDPRWRATGRRRYRAHIRSALRSAGPENFLPSAVSDPSEFSKSGRPTAPFGPASGSGNPTRRWRACTSTARPVELFGP